MARKKKPVPKVQMIDGKRNIIQQLLQEYDIQFAEDMQTGSQISFPIQLYSTYSCMMYGQSP